jgi:glutamine synthetase
LHKVVARGIDVLPKDLGEALQALQADSVVSEALGPVLTAQFIALKQAELTEYQRHVSDWELQRYAAAF